MKTQNGDIEYALMDSPNEKHSNVIITKLNLPLYKPCRCKYCIKDVSVQCDNQMRDVSVEITRDMLVPRVQTRSFIAMAGDPYYKTPRRTKDRGIIARLTPVREKLRRENSTQTNIIKNKDIDMIIQVFDELYNLKNLSKKQTMHSVETNYNSPDNPTTKLIKKEVRIHKNKTKLKTNNIKDIGNQREPKKIGDGHDYKKVIDLKKKDDRTKKDDKQVSKSLRGQVTISITSTKDFPEIRFKILSGLKTGQMQSKESNDTEREKVISTFNYVQSKT